MRLKSWLAATAGLAAAAPAVAQAPYPTNFDVRPAGAVAPAAAAPATAYPTNFDVGPAGATAPAAPAPKAGFCLPGDPLCRPSSYLDGSAVPGAPLPDLAPDAAHRLDHTFWVHGEYLLWWSKDMNTPELVTRVPSGAVGTPTTGQRLYPDARRVEFDRQNGYRVTGGVRLTDCVSLEAGVFQLETQVDGGRFAGTGLPGTDGLGRPYFPAGAAAGRVLYSALPGSYSGVVDARTTTRLYGLDAAAGIDTVHVLADSNRLLAGFRFADLAERITVTDASAFANGGVNTVQDVFATRNQFYGGQVGLHSRFGGRGPWTVDWINKFGFGGVHQVVEVFGANANLSPGGAADREAGGLLARPSNSGRFERDKGAITYDLTLNLGYQVSSRLRATFGYSIFYLSEAVRPGNAIDPVVTDGTLRFVAPADRTPGTENRPRFDWKRASSDYFAQGLNFGLVFGY